jgi:hypothetical protein
VTLTPPIHATFGEDSNRVRRSDRATSHEAADLSDVTRSIGAVLAALRDEGDMHDERIHEVLIDWGHRFSPERVRTARHALEDKGLVVATTVPARTSRGFRTTVWHAIDHVPFRQAVAA